MTSTIIGTFHHRLGWCPCRNTHASHPLNTGNTEPSLQQGGSSGQPLTRDRAPVIPEGFFTGIAITILFLTLFFGGNWWWPVLTAGVTAVFFILMFSGRIRKPGRETNATE
ncbi:MAG: hypothetical protein ABFC24_04590 [Methanoregulaceae archaeon]